MKWPTTDQRWEEASDEIIKKTNPAVAAQQEAGAHFIIALMNSSIVPAGSSHGATSTLGNAVMSCIFLSVYVSVHARVRACLLA